QEAREESRAGKEDRRAAQRRRDRPRRRAEIERLIPVTPAHFTRLTAPARAASTERAWPDDGSSAGAVFLGGGTAFSRRDQRVSDMSRVSEPVRRRDPPLSGGRPR